MRRWNGWGDDSREYPLKSEAGQYLNEILGPGKPLPEASWEDVVKAVPPSRVNPHELLQTDPDVRVRHARGQSFPDWIAMKSGDYQVFPDAVAFPRSRAEVRVLLDLAATAGYKLIPYGGGTSVAGHITPLAGSEPIVTVSMRRMNLLLDLDENSQIATIGAGAHGPEVESQLRGLGYTLGHFPQSFELSTLGGWIATRSSGQQSLRYGRIEQMFAGGHVESPEGGWDIPVFPASSAGPDLREMILGSEGRLGFITDAKVRVTPIYEREDFSCAFFPSWKAGRHAVRRLVQDKIPLSMLRLSNPLETLTNLVLAGHKTAVGALEQYLRWRGAGVGKCMLIMGITGSRKQVRSSKSQAFGVIKEFAGIPTGTILGKKWAEGRFRAPYLRESLWRRGFMVDTVESATNWSQIDRLIAAVEGSLAQTMTELGESVHAFTHLSHVYPQGSSCYTTFVFRTADTYEETLWRWRKMKAAVCQAVIQADGTISHQHGVGKDHRDYLVHEKQPVGMGILQALVAKVDPQAILNPGTLI